MEEFEHDPEESTNESVNHTKVYGSYNAKSSALSMSEQVKKKLYGLNLCFPAATKLHVGMKPTPQPSTSKRLGVINLVLCQASFLQARHTNKGMKLMLTKEEASRERKGDGQRKENMYNVSQNKKKRHAED